MASFSSPALKCSKIPGVHINKMQAPSSSIQHLNGFWTFSPILSSPAQKRFSTNDSINYYSK
jgi:hypothetical protein